MKVGAVGDMNCWGDRRRRGREAFDKRQTARLSYPAGRLSPTLPIPESATIKCLGP